MECRYPTPIGPHYSIGNTKMPDALPLQHTLICPRSGRRVIVELDCFMCSEYQAIMCKNMRVLNKAPSEYLKCGWREKKQERER